MDRLGSSIPPSGGAATASATAAGATAYSAELAAQAYSQAYSQYYAQARAAVNARTPGRCWKVCSRIPSDQRVLKLLLNSFQSGTDVLFQLCLRVMAE